MERRKFLAGAGAVTAGAVAATAPGVAGHAAPGIRHVETGLDVLVRSDFAELAGQRVGVISNPTGVDSAYRHLVDLMHGSGAVRLAAAFGPEHGFRGSAQAGGSEGTGVDARTGITVYDAYGASQAKWETMFTEAGVDTVVFDIQDVGVRFYTYIWTMYTSMVAAARVGKRYVVLDRPNPVGGRAYGPMMTTAYTSGVGLKEIVQQHGMTVGELASFFNAEFLPAAAGRPVDLHVVKCRHWKRDKLAPDTDLPWVMPSPNMPTTDTALVYPGTGLFEGVASITEGRGTCKPFELIGGLGQRLRLPLVRPAQRPRAARRRVPRGVLHADVRRAEARAAQQALRRGRGEGRRPGEVRPDPYGGRNAGGGTQVRGVRVAARLVGRRAAVLDRQADRVTAAAHDDRRGRRRGRRGRRLVRRAGGVQPPTQAPPALLRTGSASGWPALSG